MTAHEPDKTPKPRRKTLAVVLGGIIIVFLATSIMIFSQLRDLDKWKGIAEERIGKLTQRKVSIDSAELSYADGLGIKLKYVSLKSLADDKLEFAAKGVNVVIKLFPLLAQKVEVKKVVVNDPTLFVDRDGKGKFNFQKWQKIVTDLPATSGVLEMLRVGFIRQLVVKQGKIRFVDHLEHSHQDPKKPLSFELKNLHFSVKKTLLKKPYQFSLQGVIPNSSRNTVFDVIGSFENIPEDLDFSKIMITGKASVRELYLPKFKPYIKKVASFLPEGSWWSLESDFTSSLGGDMGSSGKLMFLHQREDNVPALVDPSRPLRGAVDYEISIQNDTLAIDKVNIQSGTFSLKGRGTLSHFLSDDPKVSFSIKSASFYVDQSKDYLPFIFASEENHALLKRHFKSGSIEIKKLNFDGTLEELAHLDDKKNLNKLSLDLLLKKVHWVSPLYDLRGITGNVQFRPGAATFSFQKAKYEDLLISNFKGKIKNWKDHPIVDLSIECDAELNQVKTLLRKAIHKEDFDEFLGRYRKMAGQTKVRVQMAGPLEQPERMRVSGAIGLRKGYLERDPFAHPFDQVEGNIRFRYSPPHSQGRAEQENSPWIIQFDDFSGHWGHSQVSLSGQLNVGQDSPFEKLNGRFQLAASDVKHLLDTFPSGDEFHQLLEKGEYLKGYVEGGFQIQGNPSTPEKFQYRGNVDVHDLTIKFDDKRQTLEGLSGSVGFSNNLLRLRQVRGLYGDSTFSVNGQLTDYRSPQHKFAIQIDSQGVSSNDLKYFSFLEGLEFTGPTRVQLEMEGKEDDFRFNTHLDLSSTSYRYQEDFVKGFNVPNTFSMRGRVIKQDKVEFEQFVYEVDGNKFSGSGTLKSMADPQFTIFVNASNIKIWNLSQVLLPLRGSQKGNVRFNLEAKGNLKNPRASQVKGHGKFDQLVYESEGFPHPLTFTSKIKFNGNRYEFTEGTFQTGDSDIQFRGVYQGGDKPWLELMVGGKRLVLDEVVPGSSESALGFRESLERFELFSKGITRIAFDLEKIDYQFCRMRNISGNILVKEKKLGVNKLQIRNRDDSRIQGKGIFWLASAKPFRFEAQIQAREMEAEDFLGMFGTVFQDSVTGKLRLFKADLKSKGNTWKEVRKSLMGNVSLDLHTGTLNTHNLKKGAYRLFGFPLPEKYKVPPVKENEIMHKPYKNIGGHFAVIDGVAETKDFLYDTQTRRSSTVGQFDLFKYEMDIVLGVSHLAALDKFLTQIPVVGNIITAGEEQSLVKTYYTVKGKFYKSKLKAVPFTALEKKFVGTFKGILDTPRQILTPPALFKADGDQKPESQR